MALLISGMTLAGVRTRDPSGSAQEGGAVRLAEATATALGSGSSGVNTPSGLSTCTW